MNVFQLIFAPLCALLAAWNALRGWRRMTSRRAALFWTILWAGAALAIAVPDLAGLAARTLGIGRGADLVFYLAILAGLAACRYFYNRYRRLENVITDLVRAEALKMARQSSDSAPPISRNCQST